MIETVQFLFHNGIFYKLAEFFCLNPLENYLDWKRSLVGCKESHAMWEFGFNNNVSNCTDGRYDFSDEIFHIVRNFKLSTNVCYFLFQSYVDKYCCLTRSQEIDFLHSQRVFRKTPTFLKTYFGTNGNADFKI